MVDLSDKFKINLNQNLWSLLVAFGVLGASEYYKLSTLFWFAASASFIMSVSIAFTTLAYTIAYYKSRDNASAFICQAIGSSTGWWRLWISCSVLAIFSYAYFLLISNDPPQTEEKRPSVA